jgi:hypothetical protein
MSARSEKGDGEQPPMPPQPGASPKPSLRPPPPLPPSRAVASRPPLAGAARTNPPPQVSGRDGTPASPQRDQVSELRLHVSVKTSVRDPNLLIVRPLAEGQRPPPGTREAFLVLLDTEGAPNTSNGGHAL